MCVFQLSFRFSYHRCWLGGHDRKKHTHTHNNLPFQVHDCLAKFFSRKTTTVTTIRREEGGTLPPVLTFCPGFRAGAVAELEAAPPPPNGVGPYPKFSYFAFKGVGAGEGKSCQKKQNRAGLSLLLKSCQKAKQGRFILVAKELPEGKTGQVYPCC